MTYVITEPCIGTKELACVDVCPAGCIHTTPEAPQNYIDPDVCIECEQCVLVCPVDAIFLDTEVPPEWTQYIDVNASFFQARKAVERLTSEDAARMISAARAYAARVGIAVEIVVLDPEGNVLAGTDERAYKKAYTALMYQLGTHELRPGRTPPWARDVVVDQERVLMQPGGLPVVDARETLGAVGVSGAPSPDQDLLCAQAAVSARMRVAAGH